MNTHYNIDKHFNFKDLLLHGKLFELIALLLNIRYGHTKRRKIELDYFVGCYETHKPLKNEVLDLVRSGVVCEVSCICITPNSQDVTGS